MKKTFIKVISSLLCIALIAGTSISAGAASDITTSGGNGDSKVTITTSSQPFKVTVPSVLPIWVDSDNNVTVATNAKIANESAAPVEVTQVSVVGDNGWNLVPFDTDFTKVPVDTKQYGMTMYDDDVIDGVPALLFDIIDGNSELSVQYDGNVAIQSEPKNHLEIGHVIFTIAWSSGVRLGPNDITYNVENTYVQSYMNTPTYDPDDYSYTNMTPSQSSDIIARLPAQGILSVPDGVDTITVTSEFDGKHFIKSVSGDSFAVDSLIPGVVYDYQMKDSSDSIIKEGKIYPTGQIRMINAGDNVGNIRDLGGWNSKYGTLKYGKVFRGSRLNGEGITLSTAQQDYFSDFLGIKDEIDLRNSEEVAGITQSAISDSDYTRLNTYAYRVNPYDSIQTETIKTIFTRLASDLRNNKPVYIHCAAGADRTATVIYWLEAMLGMSSDSIDREYELSSYYANNRYRCGSQQAAWNTMISDDKFYNKGDTNEERAIRYLIYCGVSIDNLNVIRREMLTGNAPIINFPVTTDVLDIDNVSLGSRLNSGAAVVAYTPSVGKSMVTDFIPINKQDVIEYYSDIAQNDNYNGYVQVYDSNKTRLATFTKNDTHIWEWNDDITHGTFRIWYLNYSTNINQMDVAYIRICCGYNDISNVSIKKW